MLLMLCVADVSQYIQEMQEVLYNLQNRMQKAKQNIEGIRQAMQVSELPRARHGGCVEASGRCCCVLDSRGTPPDVLDRDVSVFPKQKEPGPSAELTQLHSVVLSRLCGAAPGWDSQSEKRHPARWERQKAVLPPRTISRKLRDPSLASVMGLSGLSLGNICGYMFKRKLRVRVFGVCKSVHIH